MAEKSEIQKIYDVAIKEVGYLEKASNYNLDSKTANAGYNNYTKYWRDLKNMGLMSYFGYGPSSSFAGGTNWPYCAAGVCWCFIQALGKDRALQLLLHTKGYAYINCETMAALAKAAGRLYDKPQPGDVVLFYKSSGYYHTEFCYAVSGNTFKTIGFNTSGASYVVANGGGCCQKSYNLTSTSAKFFRPAYKSTALSTSGTTTSGVTSVDYLKLGSSGSAVKDLQNKLKALGYDIGKCGADGDYGSDTYNAVKAFQKANGLEVDGIAGENTINKLNVLYKALTEKKTTTTTTTTTKTEDDPSKRKVLFTGVIKKDNTNVRTWAGSAYGNIKTYPKLAKSTKVKVLDYTQKAKNGVEWYYCKITGDKGTAYGFINSKYVKEKKKATTTK